MCMVVWSVCDGCSCAGTCACNMYMYVHMNVCDVCIVHARGCAWCVVWYACNGCMYMNMPACAEGADPEFSGTGRYTAVHLSPFRATVPAPVPSQHLEAR
jgi:hypothetical protein